MSFLDIRLDEAVFAGIAEAVIASDLDGLALARIAVTVPGCRRADLADAVFARLDPKAWLGEYLPLDAAAFLHSADPERFVAVLRNWSDDPDEGVRTLGLRLLLRIGDPASAAKLTGLVSEWYDYEFLVRTRAPAVERFLVEKAEAGNEHAASALVDYLGLRWFNVLDVPGTIERRRRGEAIPLLLGEIEKEATIVPGIGLVDDPRVRAWLHAQRDARRLRYADVLSALVLAGDREAREELWSIVRCGRHRVLYSCFQERPFTLDWDFSTLPHWIEELDSNCCRVAGGLESIFEDQLGGSDLYGRPTWGLGQPRSLCASSELLWSGGDWVWSPIVDHFVPKPD